MNRSAEISAGKHAEALEAAKERSAKGEYGASH